MITGTRISTFVVTLAILTVASTAAAWSCGPLGGGVSSSIFTKSYGRDVGGGCDQQGICGTSQSSKDFLTYPEIQSMLRRGRKQRYNLYRPFLDEFRTMYPSPDLFTPWMNRRSSYKSKMSQPRYEVYESETNFKIEMDVPGVDMSNINITFDEETKVLTISGNRERQDDVASSDTNNQGETMLKRTFAQKFVLKNPSIDSTQISASLENGVLTVTLQKYPVEIKESNVRTIPIESSVKSTAEDVPIDKNGPPTADDESDSVTPPTDELDSTTSTAQDEI